MLEEINKLEKATKSKWKNIKIVNEFSIEKKNELKRIISEPTKLISGDCELIVFGSLARNEYTFESDLDWTLLIDGQVKPNHQEIALKIKDQLDKANFKNPGFSGIFGGLTFSHDLVHNIGGSDDFNNNMTRRMLLLLESESMTHDSPIVYSRVIRSVIKRYLQVIFDFSKNKYPRFLVNDMIRFWRTLCVDFAAKEWQQNDYKWVIRNIKLRFSRKLLFVSGMLMCSSIYNKNFTEQEALKTLEGFIYKSPLENLATFFNNNQKLNDLGKQIFSSYNYFLGVMNDKTQREILMNMKPNEIGDNELFQKLRKKGHNFENSLIEIFFEKKSPLKDFNRKYGVF